MATQTDAAGAVRRDATFDILKGIGIGEVMVHHLLAHSARKFAVAGSVEWWALAVTNRVLHFAVPTFLLASALLLARSVARQARPDWKRFGVRRVLRTLWPYLLWSVVYVVFRIAVVKIGDDVEPKQFVAGRTLPALLVDGPGLIEDLFWGKAYYHLYFLVVLLQSSLLFPLLFFFLRRVRLSFGGVLLLALGAQGVVFFLQATLVRAPYPASTVFWYLPPVLVGVWLGLNGDAWPAVWRAWRVPFAVATLGGLGVYLFLSVVSLGGGRIASLPFNAAVNIYTSGAALLLLALAGRLARRAGWAARRLARVGDWSLPLFLIHPLVLHLLSGPTIGRVWNALPFSQVWVGAAMLGVTWGLTTLAWRLRADRLLFGRSLAPGGGGA